MKLKLSSVYDSKAKYKVIAYILSKVKKKKKGECLRQGGLIYV